jgi:hypothetical protein
MQLVAYGAQDVYLTGNPQITFFKVVYKRHTNFSMELIQQTLSGTADFNNTVRCKIARSGDLLHNVWVNATLPALPATAAGDYNGAGAETNPGRTHLSYCNRVGFRLLKSVELRIGGQQIDRHTSLWMHLWTELSTPSEKKGEGGLNDLVGPHGTKTADHSHASGGDSGLTYNSTGSGADGSSCASGASIVVTNTITSQNKTGSVNGTRGLEIWVPLQFSFCRNPGLALPLIALQYHEVELILELETFTNCLAHGIVNPRDIHANATDFSDILGIGRTNGSLNSTLNVWGNYIFLDTEERKNFAQNPHEYLIETVQELQTAATSGSRNYRLNFNHPIKELVWVARKSQTAAVPYTADLGMTKALIAATDKSLGLSRTEAVALVSHNTNTKWGSVGQQHGQVADHATSPGKPTLLRGALTAYGGSVGNAAVTGQYVDFGDVWTDFTKDARTVYTYATESGVANADADSTSDPEKLGSLSAVADGRIMNTAATASTTNQAQGPFCFPGVTSMVKTTKLQLNGQDRFSQRTGAYFNRVQPYQHHKSCPDLGINSYSFALHPEDHQPSGTCNFSRIDNANLIVDCADNGTLFVYGHGYNVLRVASGMGGLAYSN